MHGSAQMLFQYMEGSSKRFINDTLIGAELEWRNEAENRTARVSIINENHGIADEAMWDDYYSDN